MSNPIIDLVMKSVVPGASGQCPFCEKQGLLI
ncbi:hypothetical protein SAMN05216604_1701, partial [Pseudomonas agarici]